MATNLTLEHTKQVKKIASNLTDLIHIMQDGKDKPDYRYGSSHYQHVALLNEKLISLHVYLDDVLDRLEWRHYVWMRFKKELGVAGYVLLGMIMGFAFCLPHLIMH